MRLTILVLVLVALFAVVRIGLVLRRDRSRAHDDWDARLVKNLRAAGGNAFTAYEIDFFFSLPDEASCQKLRPQLEAEGFAIDVRGMTGEASASGWSLHARKRLRVSVEDMQGYSQRFRTLAEQYGGHYDGWTSDPSELKPPPQKRRIH
jgi:Regulator of ribonuclease activity B